MIVIIGQYALLIAIILSALTIFIRGNDLYPIKRASFCLSLFLVIIAHLSLLLAFINSDFSVKIVFSTTSSLMSPLYKIAASWGSHEGSMLLWLSLLSAILLIYLRFCTKSIPMNILTIQLDIMAFLVLLFGAFIFFISSPFAKTDFLPNQGVGLNPVLQDIALALHPPLLYLGYVTFVIPFIVAVANNIAHISYNITPAIYKILLLQVKRFTALAMCFLTLGITLGAWWAYRELGWGGYWFFDPVENISLIPWICAISLHHLLIITLKTNKYHRFTNIMSSVCFLTTLYGFLLVRSGIISSVHSFAFSEEKGLYLTIICGIITLLVIIIFLLGHSKFPANNIKNNAQCNVMIIGNILLLMSAIALVISIIYPIYYLFIEGEEVAINPEYFYTIFIPIYIPILMLVAIIFDMQKINITLIGQYILLGILSLCITIFFKLHLKMEIISFAMIFASSFLMLKMIIYLILCNKQDNAKKTSLFLGHFGLGLLVFSITINSIASKEIEFIGTVGDEVKEDNFIIKLQNIKYADNKNFYRQIVEFTASDPNGNIVTLQPENRLYKIEQSLSQEADIFSFVTHDMYAVLNQIDGSTIHAVIYYKPMIAFIWIAAFMMACSFYPQVRVLYNNS